MTALHASLLLTVGTLLLAPVDALAQDPPPDRRRSSPNLITAEEIKERAPTTPNAQDIIQQLRPQWLRPRRGVQASGELYTRPQLQVYLDGIRQQGADVLRTVLREGIAEIRFLNGIDATGRFGLDHEMGAVMVTTIGKD